MKILVNAFGISSSGGITVLIKTIYEFLDNQENQYYIFVFSNQNIHNLVQEFNNIGNIQPGFIDPDTISSSMSFVNRRKKGFRFSQQDDDFFNPNAGVGINIFFLFNFF